MREGYYDGAAIVTAQDNYVVQWGHPDEKPRAIKTGRAQLAAEFDRDRSGAPPFAPLSDADTYAPRSDSRPGSRRRAIGSGCG